MNVTAIAQRSGQWWAITVPEIPGVFTQTRSLGAIPDMVVDAVRTLRSDPTLEIFVDVKPRITDEADTATQQAREAAQAAKDAQEQARVQAGEAVRALKAEGITTRDAAVMLGVSPQRISQIAKAANVA